MKPPEPWRRRGLSMFLSNTLSQVVGGLCVLGIVSLVAGGVLSSDWILWLGVGLILATGLLVGVLIITALKRTLAEIRTDLGKLIGSMEQLVGPASVRDAAPPPSVEAGGYKMLQIDKSREVGGIQVRLLQVYLDVKPPVVEFGYGDADSQCVLKLSVRNLSTSDATLTWILCKVSDSHFTHDSPQQSDNGKLHPGSTRVVWLAWDVPEHFYPERFEFRIGDNLRPLETFDVTVG